MTLGELIYRYRHPAPLSLLRVSFFPPIFVMTNAKNIGANTIPRSVAEGRSKKAIIKGATAAKRIRIVLYTLLT